MQSFAEQQRNEINNSNELYKIAFLSYYISLYVNNIEATDKNNKISVKEIFDFIQDLQRELNIVVPQISKKDISLCFYLLNNLGLCSCSR
jgi:aminoglycoside/choline kinase family phosphotransferase